MNMLLKTECVGYGDAESSCAVLDINQPMVDWLTVRVERAVTLAQEFQSYTALSMPYPFALEVFATLPDAADALNDETGWMDDGFCEATSAILDDITDEAERLDFTHCTIRVLWLVPTWGTVPQGPEKIEVEIAWRFGLHHADNDECTANVALTDITALLAKEPAHV